MLTITITARAAALFAAIALAAILTFYATDAFGSGDPPDEVRQGDINCDGAVDVLDGLGALSYEAGLPVDQNEPCFAPGSVAAIPGPPGQMGEQGLPGPPGPQGSPAFSHVADVAGNGTLRGGTATSVTHVGLGHYQVTFPEDISDCLALAGSGASPGGSTRLDATNAAFVAHDGSDVVTVRFFSVTDAAFADVGFFLVLFC